MKRVSVILASCVFAFSVVLGLWAFWLEPGGLMIRRKTLSLEKWTSEPIRIVILSDLHVGSPFNGVAKLEKIVAEANGLQPDVVVLLGDFVIQGVKGGRVVPPEVIAERLAALRAPLGIYAVLGNHDWWLDAPRVKRALDTAGIEVIDDSAIRLSHAGDFFWIAGVSDFLEGKHDVKAALGPVTAGEAVILITHNPDVFPEVPLGVSLTLAGHTHGGQVALPLIGRPIVPSRYGERYAAGHIRENGKDLFVTTGLGTSIIPVRFRVPPEIVQLTVRSGRNQ